MISKTNTGIFNRLANTGLAGGLAIRTHALYNFKSTLSQGVVFEEAMEPWTIGELARRAGIRASAIRFYENVGLLTKPPRVSGWRRYDPATVDRLGVIQTARDLGFSLGEIKTILDGFPEGTPPSARWQAVARKKLPEVEAHAQRILAIKRLLEAGLDCECENVDECIDTRGEACLSDTDGGLTAGS